MNEIEKERTTFVILTFITFMTTFFFTLQAFSLGFKDLAYNMLAIGLIITFILTIKTVFVGIEID